MDAYMNEIVTKLLEYGPGQPGKLAAGFTWWWPAACTAGPCLNAGHCLMSSCLKNFANLQVTLRDQA